MFALWTLAAALAACPTLTAELDAAEDSLQVLDLQAAAEYLDQAEAALACGLPPSADELAHFYFLDGAVAQFTGDGDGAVDAYRAARVLDDNAGLPGFDSAVAELLQKAEGERPAGTGSLDVAPTLAEPWLVRVDLGEPTTLPAAVMHGLHLVQFTDAEGNVFEGKIVYVAGDAPVVVNHELPATPPKPERVRKVIPTELTLRLGFGANMAFGSPQTATVDGVAYSEPSFKAMTPGSLSLGLQVYQAFFEVEGQVGALLDGHYLVEGDPAPEAHKLGWGVALQAGARVGSVDLGIGGGPLLPSRSTAYAMARFRPFKRAPVSLTAKAGVRSAHRLGAEPMLGLTLAYDLGLL